ncbi:hypothetical protein Q3G72_003531 [Acer saccharum]|nr:hypothetical protein Q3G72_003531 [Acer saccharum]
MLVMILFINATPSRATSLILKMSNNSGCSSIHDCLIADDQSLEFLMGSEVVTNTMVSIKSLVPSHPIANCRPALSNRLTEKETRLRLVVKMEKMWKTKGSVYVALLVLVMILFVNANPSRATSRVLNMSNNSAGSGCSSIHDCLIADDQSVGFLLGSEVGQNNMVTTNSFDPYHSIANCRPGKNYRSCLPDPRASKIGEHCNDYLYQTPNRGCP